MTETDRMQAEAGRLLDEAERLQLEGLTQREAARILETAGLGRDARVVDCLAVLGLTMEQLGALAKQRVLERLSWKPDEQREGT